MTSPCAEHERRIAALEADAKLAQAAAVAAALAASALQGVVASLVEKVSALLSAAWWVIGLLVVANLGTAGTVVVWAIGHMAAKP